MGRINCKLKVGAYMQNFGRKKAKVIIFTAVILIVVVCVGFKLQSTLNYNIMSLSETLKGQLKTEMDFYSDEAFKSVEVIRPIGIAFQLKIGLSLLGFLISRETLLSFRGKSSSLQVY